MQSLLSDIKEDGNRKFEESENYYVITSKVNYPNNRRLISQVIYIDKKLNVKEVHVINSNNNPEIKMKINSIDTNPTFNDKYFDLNENMKAAVVEEEIAETMKIEDVIFPMYIPSDTHLTDQEVVEKDEGERVILTFEGTNPFILIEETASQEEEFTIVPVYGDIEFLIDTFGALSDKSVSWISNGIEYYIASETMSQSEMLEVAKSISTIPVMK